MGISFLQLAHSLFRARDELLDPFIFVFRPSRGWSLQEKHRQQPHHGLHFLLAFGHGEDALNVAFQFFFFLLSRGRPCLRFLLDSPQHFSYIFS